mmetsp:Transcript_13505/g.33150  ORF Transcript_13505/g.33150 Transcript_13505/m.33150 type:complete len:255 (-) Transcript_13505:1275-2039(-)
MSGLHHLRLFVDLDTPSPYEIVDLSNSPSPSRHGLLRHEVDGHQARQKCVHANDQPCRPRRLVASKEIRVLRGTNSSRSHHVSARRRGRRRRPARGSTIISTCGAGAGQHRVVHNRLRRSHHHRGRRELHFAVGRSRQFFVRTRLKLRPVLRFRELLLQRLLLRRVRGGNLVLDARLSRGTFLGSSQPAEDALHEVHRAFGAVAHQVHGAESNLLGVHLHHVDQRTEDRVTEVVLLLVALLELGDVGKRNVEDP